MTLCSAVPGCARHPVGDVPISGATEGQAAAIRAELDEMQQWAPLDEVRLSKIVVDSSLPSAIGGAYGSGRQRIRLADIDDHWFSRQILRHELCHALDDQLGLRARDEASLEDVWDQVQPRWVDLPEQPNSRSALREEGFALLCDLSAGPLQALAEGQALPGLATASEWVRSRVIDREPDPPPGRFWLEPGAWDPPGHVRQYGNEALSLLFEEESVVVDADGNPIDIEDIQQEPLPLELNVASFADLSHFEGGVMAVGAVENGPAVVFAQPRGAIGYQLFLRTDDGPWSWVGPLEELPHIRAHEGQLTVAWTDDDAFRAVAYGNEE